eukprot:CAMPEP_0118851754 /NCGR_PEP_ID=MMETSP1163-20130328/1073_1 /TAXON_ID=124430 /ORGANISM="Phaeomonas parva, Strain CCMP2877" /LENGTH=410 /DNA_ID=CAMNT_0006784137 /DNA_START=255 /DNA_END=1484 /DNA_ORIENTATION=-
MDGRTLGVLGGGQLGRMMAEAGHRLGVRMCVLDPLGAASPAGVVADLAVEGSFKDEAKIRELAEICDILTVEIEHVDCDGLGRLEAEGVQIQPSVATLRLIQDKYLQKRHIEELGLPGPEFVDCPSLAAAEAAGARFGFPLMLKARRGGYDGKSNAVAKTEGDVADAYAALTSAPGCGGVYAEKWCPFTKELAVMVVRGVAEDGVGVETRAYPVVETLQKDNICHTVLAPPALPAAVLAEAARIAEVAVASLPGEGNRGIFGVEMFATAAGEILYNEMAPRPHNSGHYTMEACDTCQFENHMRAVLGLPLGATELRTGAALMLNVLGADSMEETKALCQAALRMPGAGMHWYGKASNRKGRKMAHFTVCARGGYTQLAERLSSSELVLANLDAGVKASLGLASGAGAGAG